MERIGTVEHKTRTRIFDEGEFRGHTEYLIESEPTGRPAPQAFLVHQRPEWVLPPHYHLEEQFQVVTRGGGKLGSHDVGEISIHYTSREAGYGPLIAGPDGLEYLTLRTVTDPGAWYLPGARERMRKGLRKRQATVGPIARLDAAALAALPQASCEVLIEPDDSGLAAWIVRVPAGGNASAPVHGNGGGRFHVVASGALLRDAQAYGRTSCIWRSDDEPPMPMHAGPEGLEILVLQYPRAALDALPEITPVTAQA